MLRTTTHLTMSIFISLIHSFLPSSLLPSFPSFLPTILPSFHPSFLSSSLPAFLTGSFVPSFLSSFLSFFFSFLPFCPHLCLSYSLTNQFTQQHISSRCKPVYLDYQFYDQPRHQSIGREHGSEVYWKDIHVILLGTINKEILAQYLRGPPLQIEVHDRDRKDEKSKVKPSLFGEKPEDEMINNVALVAGKMVFID